MQTNCFHCGRDDAPHPRPQPKYDVPITAAEVKKIFSDCDDFEMRTVRIGLESRLTVCVCWLDGVVAAGDVSADILRPLTEGGRLADVTGSREAVRRIEQGAVYSCATRTRTQMDALVADLTTGSAALIFDAQRKAVTFEARTVNVRAVSEPTIEKSVSGAKDAFVETLRINTSLVRRRLHTPALKLRQTVVGRQSETTVAVVYLDGIADPARVQRILDRLDTIDEQALLGRGDLEPYLTRRPRALLPQLGQTERPDKFAGALLELGVRRALVVHGMEGIDEISCCGPTRVSELKDGGIRTGELLPELLIGASYDPAEIAGGTPEENAAILRSVLNGSNRGGARASVLLNAGATIYVAGGAPTLQEGIRLAGESIDSGAALEKLEKLIEASHGTGA